jgi:anti-sigma factor RsiW
MIPARCERSRQAISLRLDGQLSVFERRLLDRHLRGCPDCRRFADDVSAHTSLLRALPLEPVELPIDLPAPRHARARSLAIAGAGALAAAAAAFTLVAPSGSHGPSVSSQETLGPARPMLIDVAAGDADLAARPVTSVQAQNEPTDVRGIFSLPA